MKLTVSFVKEKLTEHSRGEISFSRMVELLNEEVSKPESVETDNSEITI